MATKVRAISQNRYYRFCNKASGQDLNHYAPGGSNVNVYKEDGSKDQIWFLNGSKLYPESNPTKCLDRLVTNNNADVYTPNDNQNQLLTFEQYSKTDYGYYYYIRLTSAIGGKYYYLTQSGSNVIWTTTKSNNGIWLAEELIRVTNIPGIGTDYFSVWSGFSNGNFTKDTSMSNLYRKCFGSSGSGGNRNLNLFGAIFTANNPQSYKGKFHPGVDLSPGSGVDVRSPIAGTVVYSNSDYGTVTIESGGRYYLFLHMTNRIANGKPVSVGTVIGEVGGVGAGGNLKAFSPHLHVEIHSNSAGVGPMAYQTNSFNCPTGLLPVHDYF